MGTFRRFVIALFLINSFTIGTVYTQTIDEIFNKFIKRYQTYEYTTLPFYLFIPEAYNPQLHYPLVLCLHGAGERGDNASAVKNNSMAIVWARDSNQTRWPCFIVVPQCPTNLWWELSDIELTVNDILDSVLNEFPIDTNRLYITGLSMGGYGTWDMIANYPAKFAAAVPMSGGGNPSQAILIKNIPIWNFHGAVDATVSVTESRIMISALEDAGDTIVYTNCHNGDCTGLPNSIVAKKIQNGAKHLYTEYQYGGHSIWDESYNNIFLLPWVFSQSRENTSAGIAGNYYSSLPKKPVLFQNYPNPFNPITNISFTLSSKSLVSLKVFDLLGREVVILVSEQLPAGNYTRQWNAAGMPSGVYFYHISAMQLAQQNYSSTEGLTKQKSSFTETKKLVLLK